MGELKYQAVALKDASSRPDREPDTTGKIEAMLQETILDDASQKPSSFLRYSDSTLKSFREVPPSDFVVLFTPVVPPPATAADDKRKQADRPDDRPMDPFEPLGIALSKHHSRIRHVPYIPDIGMTATHRTFLEQAGAAFIVFCDASSTIKADVKTRKSFNEKQHAFNQATLKCASERGIPTLLMLVLQHPGRLDMGVFEAFEMQLWCKSYDAKTLAMVADDVYRG